MTCKKCGSEESTTVYHIAYPSAPICGYNCDPRSRNMSKKEHLHKTCRTCNYDWIIDTLDKEETNND